MGAGEAHTGTASTACVGATRLSTYGQSNESGQAISWRGGGVSSGTPGHCQNACQSEVDVSTKTKTQRAEQICSKWQES